MRLLARAPLVLLLLVVAASALVWHACVYGPFVTDDAYISFVYSKNLAFHGELVFNLGERVEGYTNFLWTVLLAGLMRLGWKPESSSIILGIALAIAGMFVSANLSRRLRAATTADRDTTPTPAALAPSAATPWSAWDALPALLLAAVPGYACWAGGGLETQLFTFLFTAGAARYLTDGPGLASGIAFGLAALTRPEGDLFFALTFVHCIIARLATRQRLVDRDLLRWVGAFCALVVPHFVWRRLYYGWWLPNTFYIKASGGAGTLALGGRYLWRFSSDYLLPVFFVLAPLGAVVQRSKAPAGPHTKGSSEPGSRSTTPTTGLSRLVGLLAVLVPAFYLYVAKVGGDFMGLYRFALPIVPLVFVGGTLGLRAVFERIARFVPRPALLAPALCALLLGAYVLHDLPIVREALRTQATVDRGVIDPPGYLRWYTEDRAAIGRWFGQYAQPDDFAAVGGAGAQVYYSGMRSLDCFGLSDAHIAHEVPPVSNRPGHQKYAPVEYQLARRPTIITSNYYNIGAAPLVRDDAAFWRSKGYHYVSVEIPGLSSPWYSFLKRMDRRIGPLAPVDPELQ